MFFNNNNCCCQEQNNNWQQQGSCCNVDSCGCDPIIEQPIEHTYRPEYSCSEENTVTNIDPGCCGSNF